MGNKEALELAIEKHQEALRWTAKYIAGNYEPEIEPEKAYEMLVDAIRNGRGDIIEAWRFGYKHFPNIPLNSGSAGIVLMQIIQIYNLIKS